MALLGPGDFLVVVYFGGCPSGIGLATAITPTTVMVIEKKEIIRVLQQSGGRCRSSTSLRRIALDLAPRRLSLHPELSAEDVAALARSSARSRRASRADALAAPLSKTRSAIRP